jgi:hypothetical protein
MKAYEATFRSDREEDTVVLVGANSLSGAARKAEDQESVKLGELIKLELTEKVII